MRVGNHFLSNFKQNLRFILQQSHYNMKQFSVGSNGDKILTYGPEIEPIGFFSSKLLGKLMVLPSNVTLAVLPEGAMINYLSKLHNSIPYISFMWAEQAAFGEEVFLSSLKHDPPNYIVMVRHMKQMKGYFGPDFGETILKWLTENYKNIWEIYEQPVKEDSLGFQLWEYNHKEN